MPRKQTVQLRRSVAMARWVAYKGHILVISSKAPVFRIYDGKKCYNPSIEFLKYIHRGLCSKTSAQINSVFLYSLRMTQMMTCTFHKISATFGHVLLLKTD